MEKDEQTLREKAKYLVDEQTLKDNRVKDATEIDLKILNVSKDNYKKYKSNLDYENMKNDVLNLVHRKAFNETSELIVEWIENHNHIYTTKDDKSSEVWFYRNGIYIPNGRWEIKEICREILGNYYMQTITKQVTAKIEADTLIDPVVFFDKNYTYEIPVQNGILNVLTKKLVDYSPEKIFFNKMPVIYDPLATCPLIDKFLIDVLAYPDDKIVFYEIAGFGLVKDYMLEKAIMMVGDGRNGKSKSMELLKRMVGIENCASLPLISLTPDSFCLSELFGKLYNLAGDLSSTALKDTGMFKSLTGRDIVSARRKFLRDITFKNHAKFLFACNELPRVYDYSIGFWERWILLEFPYRFVDLNIYEKAKPEERRYWKIKDDNIIERISTPEELSGLLNQALEGLDRLLKNKRFSYSKGTDEIKNTWIRRSDSFMAFCLDHLEDDFEGSISKKELRKFYHKYCKTHKVRGVSDKSIKATLQELYGVSEEYTKLLGDYQIFAWTGIKWK